VMRLLLDTHVFLWYITADPKLPESFQGAIQNASNDVFLISISVWEAVIKHGLGKLSLPALPQPIFRNSEQPMESRRCQLTRGRWFIWLSFHPFTVIRLIAC